MEIFQAVQITSKFSWCMRFPIRCIIFMYQMLTSVAPFEKSWKRFCTCMVCQVCPYNGTALILKASWRLPWWNLINIRIMFCFQSLHCIIFVFRLSKIIYYKTQLKNGNLLQFKHCFTMFLMLLNIKNHFNTPPTHTCPGKISLTVLWITQF